MWMYLYDIINFVLNMLHRFNIADYVLTAIDGDVNLLKRYVHKTLGVKWRRCCVLLSYVLFFNFGIMYLSILIYW